MRFHAIRSGAAILLSAAVSGAALAAPAPPERAAGPEAALDQRINRQMEKAGIAGLGAAIILDGKIAWTKGYGFADVARAVPFTPETTMNIGSISKTVTGVAMMHLVEEGKLSLDADVDTWLPFDLDNPHFPGEPITLRQLATHTSTVSDHWPVYQKLYHFGGDAPQPLGEFLRSYFVPGGEHYAESNFVRAKPGTHQEYSNLGAALAGYIVERVAGERLDAYTRRRIFTPLGMRHSGWFLADIDRAQHSTLYVAQNGFTLPIPLYGHVTYPDGGVRTSVADLSRLFVALLGDGTYRGRRVLGAEALAEMLRFQFDAGHKPVNLDLSEDNSGLFWSTKLDVTRIGHGGSDPGLKTEMLANLDKDIGVVLFSNTSLAEQELGQYFAIFTMLWKHAEAIKAGSPRAASH
jgi:CubicO group peptidase (beta-lactamase class C family)